MLEPNKYTNIDISLLGVAAEILKILNESCVEKYSQLLFEVLNKRGNAAEEVFLPALCFLFLVEKISYHPTNDLIELIGNTRQKNNLMQA